MIISPLQWLLFRLFDDAGEGYITVQKFREILREIDPTIMEDELDDIISDVSPTSHIEEIIFIFQVDNDGSGTIDFEEFCSVMS